MKASRLAPALLLSGLLSLPALLHAQVATTAIPGVMSYQGRVLDASGNPVGNNNTPVSRTITFRIWDHPSNNQPANLIYSEQQTVTIADGEFSVLVGQGQAVTSTTQFGYSEASRKLTDFATAFSSPVRYLGVTVDDGVVATIDNEITPRQQIVTTGFAFRSKVAESLGTSTGSPALNTLDNGNVGVGSTNPAARFTVTGTVAGAAGTQGQLLITDSDPAKGLRIGMDGGGSGTGFLQTAGFQNLILNPLGGNVGIGKVPTTKLDVNGEVKATMFTGSVADSNLTPNVVLLNRKNQHSAENYFDKNTGIGTTTPGFPLTFANTLGDKISLWGQSGGHYGFGIQNGLFQIHSAEAASDVAFGYGQSSSFTETMRIKGSGLVGIGTNSPLATLHTYTPGGLMPLLADGSSAAGTWFGLRNTTAGATTWQFISTGSGNGESAGKLIIGTGTPGFLTSNAMTLTSSSVGIGTSSPDAARLVVAGGPLRSNLFGGYLNIGGAGAPTVHGQHTISIQTSNTIWCGHTVICTSDDRIKNVKGRSNGANDLQKLLGIEVTDYNYKDAVSQGAGDQKKVIAQQVEKVFPQAVSQHTGTVPDIYKKGTFKDGWIKLATPLKKGDRVRLISGKTDEVVAVTEAGEGKFRTEFKAEDGDEIFVYGREVKDFRAVDYEAISMLNVSATQQIKKEKDEEIKTLRDENSALQKEILALKTELRSRDAKDKTLDARMAAIEKALAATGESREGRVGKVTGKTAGSRE